MARAPDAIQVITDQARKGELTEEEVKALKEAHSKIRRGKLVGLALGAGMGYHFSRKKHWAIQGLSITINSVILLSISEGLTTFMAMRELADSSKYPHIVAAMKDIRNEIQRSQGVDPSRPELGRRGTIPHQPDFKHLPPSTTSKEREVAHVEGHSTYKGLGSSDSMEERNEHSQREFGNPILQEKLEHEQFGNEQQFNSEQLGHEQKQPSYRVGDAGTDSNSAWNTIRSANNSQLSAWDRVRKQSGQHSTKSQEQQPYGSWTRPHQQEYDGYHNGGGFASSNGDSGGSVFEGSALSSDDFPRSREDFEGSSSTDDKHKYEFSS